jgi:hypothetical protein
MSSSKVRFLAYGLLVVALITFAFVLFNNPGDTVKCPAPVTCPSCDNAHPHTKSPTKATTISTDPPTASSPTHSAEDWNFQTDYFCPDVKAAYDPLLIKDYLEKRRNFYYKVTDKVNSSSPEWSGEINIQWDPVHKFYNLLGPIVDLCPTKVSLV